MVYAGANDGMLHGFLGTNGLQNNLPMCRAPCTRGRTAHRKWMDWRRSATRASAITTTLIATPYAFDAQPDPHGRRGSGAPNWHTLLIGGLGKGGTSFYAIDITDPGQHDQRIRGRR